MTAFAEQIGLSTSGQIRPHVQQKWAVVAKQARQDAEQGRHPDAALSVLDALALLGVRVGVSA